MPGWVTIKKPAKIITELNLNIGEQEAISLAKEIGATDILLDDMEARNVAASYGLSVTGTLGVLILGARRNLLDISQAFEKLKNTNARIKPELIEYILKNLA